jgi:alkylation response protein AidB-like acyl-CoA dehydrogenase
MSDLAAVQANEHDAEMMRSAVRRVLVAKWTTPNPAAASRAKADVESVWRALCEIGIAEAISVWQEGGLSVTTVAFQEFGRALCPVPLLGAALGRLATHDAGLHKQIASGDARLAVALPETALSIMGARAVRHPEVGSARQSERRLVESIGQATHLLLIDSDRFRLLDLAVCQGAFEPAEGLLQSHVARLQVPHDSVGVLQEGDPRPLRLVPLAWIFLTARAAGAARRAFELTTDHVATRRQFGRPIGSFQAVQHKLADAATALKGVELTLASLAATAPDDEAWVFRTAALRTFASSTLRQHVLAMHELMGAVGFSEEHELPWLFRQMISDVTRCGGATVSGESVIDAIIELETRR